MKKRRERSTLVKKSTLHTRCVSGFVLLFLLLSLMAAAGKDSNLEALTVLL